MKFPISSIAAAIAGVGLGALGASLIPVFDMPFSGCQGNRWFNLQLGCSHWLELLRGAFFVLPIALLAPVRWMLPVSAVGVLFLLALVGGFAGIQAGLHLGIRSITDIYHLFLVSYQTVVGGFVVLVFWLVIGFRGGQDSAPNQGFNRPSESSGPGKPGGLDGGAV